MDPSSTSIQPQPDDREGLSPSPDEPSPGVVRIADLLREDDDDIEFEPWDEQSDDREGVTDALENGDDEYAGMVRSIWISIRRCWLTLSRRT
jgi:hypothetical protein